MEKTNYAIIGGGLTGCILAFLISKKLDNVSVAIFESNDHLLSSLDCININDKKLNNGYHALELPRAQKTFEIISQTTNLKFRKLPNKKGIIVNEELIGFNSKFEEWPKSLKKYFNKKIIKGNIEYLKDQISDEYVDILKKVSKRYCDDFAIVEHLMIPWFLPKNYLLNTGDEGDIFRNEVFLDKHNSYSIVPHSGLFEEIQEPFQKKLEELNIELKFNQQIKINSDTALFNSSTLNPNDFKKIFFCSSPILILKQINFELFKKLTLNKKSLYNVLIKIDKTKLEEDYSEILVLDEKDISISRLSFPKNLNSDNCTYVQVEVFEKNNFEYEIKKRIVGSIRRILKINENFKIELLGLFNSRQTFYPSKNHIKSAMDEINNWKIKNEYNLEFVQPLGPINMAKSAIIAEENITYL